MRALLLSCIVLLFLVNNIICPPVTEIPPSSKDDHAQDSKQDEDDLIVKNLEYNRYLKEVISVLESDEAFKKKLEASNVSEIRSGEIAKHVEFVSHGIRTQLDELKRKEIDRLNQVIRLKTHLHRGMKRDNPSVVLPSLSRENIMGHLNHNNPNSFEGDDLAKLIKKATADLDEVDQRRREEFKRYEMEKELLRRKEQEQMNQEQREEAERKFREQQQKHADHPKLLHPGNEAQLKEVWEESDGLNKNDFDPKTFFNMHDTNGDGFLDETEVEALFQYELDKIYDSKAPEDDMVQRYEEMNRMREHVMNEVDTNKDKLISLEEFLETANSQEFKKNKGWKTLEEKKVYSEEDLAVFQKTLKELERKIALDKQKAMRGKDQVVQGHQSGVIDMHQQQEQRPDTAGKPVGQPVNQPVGQPVDQPVV